MNKVQISVVVPVYNEAESIQEVFSALKREMAGLGIDYEIIAVNDASRDGSGEALARVEGIQVITHEKNRGYGASLKTGIKNSQYGYILIIDADGTYPVAAIPELVQRTGQYDMVIGARITKNNAIPFERKYAKKFLNRFASYLAGQKIPDLNSGLRIFKKDIALKYWELFPERFSFSSTMICLSHGYSTIFVPIDYHKRAGKSSIRPGDFFKFMRLVTKLSLFFKPFKVFTPISLIILLAAAIIGDLFLFGITEKFFDSTFIVLCATALQTFFFGLLAEIIIHNK